MNRLQALCGKYRVNLIFAMAAPIARSSITGIYI